MKKTFQILLILCINLTAHWFLIMSSLLGYGLIVLDIGKIRAIELANDLFVKTTEDIAKMSQWIDSDLNC